MARHARYVSVVAAGSALFVAACGGGGVADTRHTLVDDMEDAENALDWQPPTGAVHGVWETSVDCTQADSLLPKPIFAGGRWTYAELPVAHETFPGVMSSHAARVTTTSPLVGTWGGSMSFDWAERPRDAGTAGPADGGSPPGVDPRCVPGWSGSALDLPMLPVDLSTYTGLTFWAMADRPLMMWAALDDRHTNPWGEICKESGTSAEQCYNAFGTPIALTTSFRQYTIDFSTLRQKPGWGYQADPPVPDLQHAYGMNFEIDLPPCAASPTAMCAGESPGLSFDVWVDDVYLVNK